MPLSLAFVEVGTNKTDRVSIAFNTILVDNDK